MYTVLYINLRHQQSTEFYSIHRTPYAPIYFLPTAPVLGALNECGNEPTNTVQVLVLL